MARRRSDEITETINGTDKRGAYTGYRYADGSEYTTRCFVKDTSVSEDSEGKTYMERIAPQMVPFDKYLAKNNLTKQEWWRRHEEAAQSRIHNCGIKTTIVSTLPSHYNRNKHSL
ncbi:MAG: hypothetical protein ACI4DP_13455 [Candidatus Ornithomonoglobus sp.]